jgi:hypothetical protein
MRTTSKLAVITAFTFIALAVLGVSGCRKSAQEQGGSQVKKYTCSMHPEVVQDQPGKCPKCGMDLIEKH